MSFDDFVTYATALSPGFLERTRGASPEEIQLLTEWVGFPLPTVHAQFLARMGHGDGGARVAAEGSTDIADVLEWYRVDGEDRLQYPESAGLAPVDRVNFEVDLVVGTIALKVRPGGDPSVVMADRELETLIAESFVGYLCRGAFNAFRCVQLRYRLSYGSSYHDVGSRGVMAEVGLLCSRLGFAKEWFSDGVSFCGEREGVIVQALQYAGGGLTLVVYSDDLQRAQEVGDSLMREFNLRYVGRL